MHEKSWFKIYFDTMDSEPDTNRQVMEMNTYDGGLIVKQFGSQFSKDSFREHLSKFEIDIVLSQVTKIGASSEFRSIDVDFRHCLLGEMMTKILPIYILTFLHVKNCFLLSIKAGSVSTKLPTFLAFLTSPIHSINLKP